MSSMCMFAVLSKSQCWQCKHFQIVPSVWPLVMCISQNKNQTNYLHTLLETCWFNTAVWHIQHNWGIMLEHFWHTLSNRQIAWWHSGPNVINLLIFIMPWPFFQPQSGQSLVRFNVGALKDCFGLLQPWPIVLTIVLNEIWEHREGWFAST